MDGKMIGAPKTLLNEEETIELACSLYERGAWAESFRLLMRLSATGVRSAAMFYDLALCLMQASALDKALAQLDKALNCVKGVRREMEKPLGEEEVLRTLQNLQNDRAQYIFPMRMQEESSAAAYARERILRLMIDLCAQKKDTERVKLLAASLPGTHFENIDKALLSSTKEN